MGIIIVGDADTKRVNDFIEGKVNESRLILVDEIRGEAFRITGCDMDEVVLGMENTAYYIENDKWIHG